MTALMLSLESYRDRVFGGWQGRSAGITLGAPMRGLMAPGRNNFYAPVPGQPAASRAIDFPLVWLKVLETTGPEVQPEDLAVAWLEHLDYVEDELAYAALNLRRGLPPPASGAHSNWFRHSTAGVVRADFWGMIAPGAPQVAAAYAYHDAKLDHCEDGLWAAMFLAALNSAAFFLTDPIVLLTIGLAMMPRTCRAARAVKTVIAAWQRAAGWLEARESVLNEVGDKNYTDVAQNLGFFTIGLLYGQGSFAGSLLAGVNCGYDTEAVGGALGSVLGIRQGGETLPAEWMRPVGDLIIPGMGLRDFDAPGSISEVVDRIAAVGRQVTAARIPHLTLGDPPAASFPRAAFLEMTASPAPPAEPVAIPTYLTPDDAPTASAPPPDGPAATDYLTPEDAPLPMPEGVAPRAGSLPGLTRQPVSEAAAQEPPAAPEAVETAPGATVAPDLTTAIAWADSTLVKPLLVTPASALVSQLGPYTVVMDTHETPTIGFNQPKTLTFTVLNTGAAPFSGRVSLLAPPGWQITPPGNLGQRQFIAAQTGSLSADFVLSATQGQARIEIANAVTLRLTPENGGPIDAEFVLLGASCWWTVGPFANFDGEGFDRSYAPEDRPGLQESYPARSSQLARWERRLYPESALDLEPLFRGSSGVCYGQTVLRSPAACEARLVANTNSGVKLWLNGALVFRRFNREIFRPLLGGGNWAADVTLRAGDNPILVKWVRGSEPYNFSLTVSDRYGRGLPEVGDTAW